MSGKMILKGNTGLCVRTDGSETLTTIIDTAGVYYGDLQVPAGSISNTELAGMARGTVKVGNASGAASDLNAKTSGQILVGNGTDVVSVPVSGDATLDSTGALTVTNTNAVLSVNISSAQLLALNTTPIQLVAAPASGFTLEFLGALMIYKHVATDYTIASSTNLAVKYTDASGATASTTLATTGFIDQAGGALVFIKPVSTNVIPVDAAALVLTLAGGNPTTGDGTLTIKIRYRTVATA